MSGYLPLRSALLLPSMISGNILSHPLAIFICAVIGKAKVDVKKGI
jgi:hypothetical protein